MKAYRALKAWKGDKETHAWWRAAIPPDYVFKNGKTKNPHYKEVKLYYKSDDPDRT